uniref:GT23 domain-containing protein n=1 Tax=Ciona savignyi TaxID=51511 RepID=H2YJ14_CIOSA
EQNSPKEPCNFNSKSKLLIRQALQKTFQLKELFRDQAERLMKQPNDTESILKHFERISRPLENSLLGDLEMLHDLMAEEDGKEIQELNEIAQAMIYKSQNPSDCKKANKLHCSVDHVTCGFGCLMHDYGLCMFVAAGETRAMQYDLNQLQSYPGINSTFKYPSETCVDTTDFGTSVEWRPDFHVNATSEKNEVVTFPITGPYTSHSLFSPGTVPDQLIPRIERVHADPTAWWTGHIISYFLRPQQHILNELEAVKLEIKFSHPIVGLHVRRTDKITEAAYFTLEMYMYHVENWYERYSMKNPDDKVTKRVYLATDEAEIVKEAKTKYPEYTFVTMLGKLLNNSQDRHSDSALKSILFDVLLLKECNFTVVTFSSNVGRLVYELQQNLPKDPSFSTVSLDDPYHYWGEIGQVQVATMEHNPPSSVLCSGTQQREYFTKMRTWTCELQLKVGDKLQMLPFMQHNYLIGGYNRRTGLHGLYPAHKVKDVITAAPYPTY